MVVNDTITNVKEAFKDTSKQEGKVFVNSPSGIEVMLKMPAPWREVIFSDLASITDNFNEELYPLYSLKGAQVLVMDSMVCSILYVMDAESITILVAPGNYDEDEPTVAKSLVCFQITHDEVFQLVEN